MKEILIDVVVKNTNISQDKYNSREIWFVDRVYSINRDGNKHIAYSNDSSYYTKEEAHERKAQIIKEELF